MLSNEVEIKEKQKEILNKSVLFIIFYVILLFLLSAILFI